MTKTKRFVIARMEENIIKYTMKKKVNYSLAKPYLEYSIYFSDTHLSFS